MAEANGWKRLATNSAKIINILGGYGYQPTLASMEACVEAARERAGSHERSIFRAAPCDGPQGAAAIALVAKDGFSARYDLDRVRGDVLAPEHKLAGEWYVDRILVLDTAKGGVATAWMLHEMTLARRGAARDGAQLGEPDPRAGRGVGRSHDARRIRRATSRRRFQTARRSRSIRRGTDIHPRAVISPHSAGTQAHGAGRRKADRDRGARALAHRKELDGEHAQAERHVQCQRHHDRAFGDFHQRCGWSPSGTSRAQSAPLSAVASARKWIGRKIASAMPASRCSSAATKPGWACEARIIRYTRADSRAQRPRPSSKEHSANTASAMSRMRPRHGRPFAQDVAQPDRRVDRHRQHEHDIEGEEPVVAARAAQNLAGGQPAAHGIKDGGEMHGDGEREHRGRGALRQERASRSCAPPQRARHHGALQAGDRIGRRDRLGAELRAAHVGMAGWQPVLPDTARNRVSWPPSRTSLTKVQARLSAAGPR